MFVEGANDETFSIVYNIQSTQKELKELLNEKMTHIERLGLVFHNAGLNSKQFFRRTIVIH